VEGARPGAGVIKKTPELRNKRIRKLRGLPEMLQEIVRK